MCIFQIFRKNLPAIDPAYFGVSYMFILFYKDQCLVNMIFGIFT